MTISKPLFAMSVIAMLGASFAHADPFYAPGESLQLIAPPPALPPRALVPGDGPLQQETFYGPADGEVIEYHEIQPYAAGPVVELYPNVIYRDQRRIAPGAVPYLVEVPLPQGRRARGCLDCGPTCALIKICVPPCETPCVKVRRHGFTMIYDFGKYEVRIVVRRTGTVIVNYNA